jgi:hypothetical protein
MKRADRPDRRFEYGWIAIRSAATVDADGDGPDPILAIPKNPDGDVFQTGACTYQEGVATGIIVGDTYLSGVQFRLVATGLSP